MKSLTAILADVGDDYGVSPLFELYEWLEAKVGRSGVGALTRPGRAIFLAQRYDVGMTQGGYGTLMVWDHGVGIMPMVAALCEVGAPWTAGVLGDLASQFPSGAIPDDPELRHREYYDLRQTRRRRKRMQWALHFAKSREDVNQICLEYARSNLVELATEDTEQSAAPDPAGT